MGCCASWRRRSQTVLDVLPVGVFLADASGRTDEINEAAQVIWGKTVPWTPITRRRPSC